MKTVLMAVQMVSRAEIIMSVTVSPASAKYLRKV